jgi:hypothetical protein
LANGSGSGIVNLQSLVDPKSREDDITMLLVNRVPASATPRASSA